MHEPEGPVIEVGGVGMLVRVSATTAPGAPRRRAARRRCSPSSWCGRSRSTSTGSRRADERTLFEAFTSVNGVGPRLGLAICGVAGPDELRLAIARGDSARLQAASGVGKRTAERIVLELRDRLGSLNGASARRSSRAPPTPTSSARDGLVALGFRPEEADAALADAPAGLDAEGLVRHGLAALRRK